MKSVYLKNFIILAGLLLISFLIFGIAFSAILRDRTISEKRDTLYSNATVFARNAESHMAQGSIAVLDKATGRIYEKTTELTDEIMWQYANIVAVLSGNNVLVCDGAGYVILSSGGKDSPELERQLSTAVLDTIDQAGEYNGMGTLGGFYGTTYYVVGLPIQDRLTGAAIGYVFVSADASSALQTWRAFATMFVVLAVIVMTVAIGLALVTAHRQAAPLREMASVANDFAHGDYSRRVTSRGRVDEIGELTFAFNAMADHLEQSESMRQEFVANVSHELKTPMTTITGFAEGILDGTIPPERQNEYLQVIASETKRLSRLVRRMLEISTIQSMETRPEGSFDVSETLRRTLLSLERKINDKQLEVNAQLPEEPVVVCGDEDAIVQVVYNLLDNAIKFSDPGTELGLELWNPSGKVFVTVKNRGQTIPPEELAQIFDRFHKTDKARSSDKDGVGLGLYIVKTILNRHGEDIFVKSDLGWTEFTFTLTPRAKKK